MKQILRSRTFGAITVGLLASSLVLHHLWITTEMEALHILAYAAFAGLFCGCGYALLTE